jgi:tetratricopeptide (TPR) repeat protein
MEAYDKAIVEYREALRRDPDMPERDEVLLELAECLHGAWRHEELAETIRQCPRSARTLTMLAESRFRQNDSDHAQKLVEQALSLAPDDLEALLLKGTMELASGGVANAAEALQRAVEKHPYDFRARNKLAQAYARLDQADLANEQAEESLRLRELRVRFTDLHMEASADIGDADLRYQLGETAMELGRPDLAMSWFALAVGMDPNHVRAREALQLGAEPQAGVRESDAQPATE